MNIKWSNLTNDQKNQVKAFYKEEMKKKEVFEHDLNKRSFLINPYTGNLVTR